MLKKVVIAGAVSAVAMLGVAGVAYADSGEPDCSSHETTKQKNDGDQAVGGNANVQDITGGWIVGSIDKAGVCPAGLNNNG